MSIKLRTPYVLTLLDAGTAPTAEANIVKLFARDPGTGTTELFVRNENGTTSQITSAGTIVSGVAAALQTAADPVSTSGSAAPGIGYMLVATSPTTATWQAVSSLTAGPTGLTVGGGNVTGTSNNLSRADHVHSLPGFSTSATAGAFTEANDPRLSNDRTASGIRTSSGVVSVSGAAAPGVGQTLVATSSTGAAWQTLTTAPSGGAGGDLAGSYPAPLVLTSAALKSGGQNVNTSSAAAPTSGQVLTATSGTTATWQAPSSTPTGSAGGDLSGTYPNPSVVASPALKTSGAGSVNTSAAPAPTTGQVLTATSSSNAVWQTPTATPIGLAGGELGGSYPNPDVLTSAALKSATGNVSTAAAAAPSPGQVLTATSDETATWQTPTATPIGDAGGDLSDDYPNPTVLASGGLKSQSSTVVTSTALAPTAGQVLTATSDISATWQLPNRNPTGAATGDLSGNYPNPSVVTSAALKTLTSNVSTSAAAAPVSGQVLTATSSSSATWQSPSGTPTGTAGGDLSGSYPNPTVTTSRAIKSGANDVVTSTASPPSAGQVLTATSSTAANWQTPVTTLPPSGPAGGDLAGNYPNPTVTSSDGLRNASGVVSVVAAAAPTSGQVLTATSGSTAVWQNPTGGGGGGPTGAAGGDLDGFYPNPTVTTARGLKTLTTTVEVESAAAPTAGQVLTAIDGVSAEWQDFSGSSPTGAAGGDLSGTYPNPDVARSAALKSATTTVNTSSATAPSAGQVLTATSSTAATWQNPSGSPTGPATGDLTGNYPNPSVATSAALKNLTTSVSTSAAAEPTSGQVLTATSSTTATWQDSSGTPTGPATGDLTGNYPNPSVAASAALKSSTGIVSTSAATAPTTGQVLTATDSSTATWQSPATSLPPTGTAGGDLSGTYPNPTVMTAAALKSVTGHVSAAAAVAPISGQVLTATSSTTAIWQTPNVTPTGAAGGDLTGSYPNPQVVRSAALKSATGEVSTSSAPAPSAGQVLTATSGIAATWQSPPTTLPPSGTASGDLSGTYPGPTVTQARGLKSASTTVAVDSATAPTAGQVLTATSSTAATWQTPSGGGGGTATELATTGAAVVVNTASPPSAGQVLTALSATSANWQTPSGGGGGSSYLNYGFDLTRGNTDQTTADEIATTLFNPTGLSGVVRFVAVLECGTVGQTASLELYNTSDGATVQTISTTNTTPTRVTSSVLSLPSAEKLYGARLSRTGGTSSDRVSCRLARFENTAA